MNLLRTSSSLRALCEPCAVPVNPFHGCFFFFFAIPVRNATRPATGVLPTLALSTDSFQLCDVVTKQPVRVFTKNFFSAVHRTTFCWEALSQAYPVNSKEPVLVPKSFCAGRHRALHPRVTEATTRPFFDKFGLSGLVSCGVFFFLA